MLVKDFSMSKDLVIASFAASSVFAAYLCRKRRARATCVVKRSVGVGDEVGAVCEGGDAGFDGSR